MFIQKYWKGYKQKGVNLWIKNCVNNTSLKERKIFMQPDQSLKATQRIIIFRPVIFNNWFYFINYIIFFFHIIIKLGSSHFKIVMKIVLVVSTDNLFHSFSHWVLIRANILSTFALCTGMTKTYSHNCITHGILSIYFVPAKHPSHSSSILNFIVTLEF